MTSRHRRYLRAVPDQVRPLDRRGLLTILGYSVNDTVVIFDRLRENLAKYKQMPLRDDDEPYRERNPVADDHDQRRPR